MADHKHYAELCASAAAGVAKSGQLSEAEWSDLIEHLPSCEECRGLLRNFSEVSFELLAAPIAADGTSSFVNRAKIGPMLVRPRFERTTLGVYRRRSAVRILWASALVAVLLALCVPLGLGPFRRQGAGAHPLTAQVVDNSRTVAATDRNLNRALIAENARLASQLQSMERREANELASAKAAEDELKSRIAKLEGTNVDLAQRDLEKDSHLAQLHNELQALRSERDAEHIVSVTTTNELTKLRDTNAKQATELSQLREVHELNGAAERAKELIIARNLHMVDVHDNQDGKRSRAFGRILYTEGKSLVFYAYDLPDPGQIDAKVAFYVWGERLGEKQPVRSLGTFRIDDRQEGRWLLTFADPTVLKQIDTVFVTAESTSKSVVKPSGEQVLYAYLGDKANHP